jgi:hypothetical protein
MVLMDAVVDLTFPDPSTREFVPVAALVKEDVARLKFERLGLGGIYANASETIKIQVSALNVGHA